MFPKFIVGAGALVLAAWPLASHAQAVAPDAAADAGQADATPAAAGDAGDLPAICTDRPDQVYEQPPAPRRSRALPI